MVSYNSKMILSLFFYLLLATFLSNITTAQDTIGGPYKADTSTVVLMHFNENFDNASDHFKVGSPLVMGDVFLDENDVSTEFNSHAQINNNTPDLKSHLQIPDTTALDLTGSWTIEMWVRIDSFGTGAEDWRYQPRLVEKPGSPMYSKANYSMYINGSSGDLESTYYSESADKWVSVRSTEDVITPDHWYHVTYIHDNQQKAMVQLIHENASQPGQLPQSGLDSLALVDFAAHQYNESGDEGSPLTSGQPLFIGTSPDNDTSFANLDGAVDEVRVSNVVRDFTMPAAINNITDLENQPPNTSITVEAEVLTFAATKLSTVNLHYQVDDGSWQMLEMNQQSGDIYAADIPGQPLSTKISYWVSARTEAGYQSRSPELKSVPSQYTFGIWEDSTEILNLNFEGAVDGEAPTDQSIYENQFQASGDPTYPTVEEMGQVLQLSAEDSSVIVSEAPQLSSSKFSLEVTFQPQDSIPSNWTRLLVKEGAVEPSIANYQVFFYDGQVTVRTDIEGVGRYPTTPPAWTITDATIQSNQWYRLWFSYSQDTVRAQLFSLSDTTYIGGITHSLDGGPHFAQTTAGPLKIGSMSGSNRYFNGQLGKVQLYNFVPDRFKRKFTSIPQQHNSLPQETKLGANYPNPFNPTTTISYQLAKAEKVTLKVYNMIGREVATLVDERQSPGSYTVNFNGKSLSSGVYIYRMRTEEKKLARKMLLIK